MYWFYPLTSTCNNHQSVNLQMLLSFIGFDINADTMKLTAASKPPVSRFPIGQPDTPSAASGNTVWCSTWENVPYHMWDFLWQCSFLEWRNVLMAARVAVACPAVGRWKPLGVSRKDECCLYERVTAWTCSSSSGYCSSSKGFLILFPGVRDPLPWGSWSSSNPYGWSSKDERCLY